MSNMHNNKEKTIILTESNVLDIYRKLLKSEDIPQEELEYVKKRFKELCEKL